MDQLAPALIVAALLLGVGPGLWYEMKARQRLSAHGEKHAWYVYWLGAYAGRHEFTPEGWRYHVRSMRFILAGVLLAVAVGVLVTR